MLDPIAQLKSRKTDPKLGWASAVVRQESRTTLLEAIGFIENEQTVAAPARTVFMRFTLRDVISRPLATAGFAFVFVMGGWITTVNASAGSLPGDTLYGLKIVTEKTQLRLASLEDRAVLHTEFASRRLEEAVAMAHSSDDEKSGYVQSTMDAFQKEIQLAQADLQELSSSGNPETVAVANVIDSKIDALHAVIVDSSPAVTDATSDGSTTAQDATEQISDAVVGVLVDSHEAQPETSPVDVEGLFRKQVVELTNAQSFALGRLARVERALAAHPELVGREGIPSSDDLAVLESEIVLVTDRLPEAMNLLAAHGSRGAFDVLTGLRDGLRASSGRLASYEIAITNALVAPAPLSPEASAIAP